MLQPLLIAFCCFRVTMKEKMANSVKNRVIAVHQYCTGNHPMLSKDKLCGCFYCLEIYSPKEIIHWIEETSGLTALCPRCGTDSVIGESSGYPITEDFLKDMNEYWF